MNWYKRLRRYLCLLMLGTVLAELTVSVALAEPSVTILSPPSGTQFAPGDSFELVVEVTDSEALKDIALIGGLFGTFGPSQPSSPEVRFSVTIPDSVSRGPKFITAFSRLLSNDEKVTSDPSWFIAVVDSDMSGKSLLVEPLDLTLAYPGRRVFLTIRLKSEEGRSSAVANSGLLQLQSSDDSVIRTRDAGELIAVGPGSATISVSYLSEKVEVRVRVRAVSKGDFDGDNDIDSEDLMELEDSLGDIVSSDLDVRDINNDGKITEDDLDALKLICTRRRCAAYDSLYGMLPDTTPPVVAITTPTSGDSVRGVVSVVAVATDDDLVRSVSFYADGVEIGSPVSVSPYAIEWNARKATVGTHELIAVAVDDSDNSTTSAPVSVEISKGAGGSTGDGGGNSCAASGASCKRNKDCCSSQCQSKVCQ